MRKYTFPRFLKMHIRTLTEKNTNSIHMLVDEACAGNKKVKAPLALYAMCYDKTHLILRFITNEELRREYENIFANYDKESIAKALAEKSDALPAEYHDVWEAYEYCRDHHEHDAEKEKMRLEIKKLQAEKSISIYRMCLDTDIKQANVNSWLKHGNPNLISKKVASKLLEYMRSVEKKD